VAEDTPQEDKTEEASARRQTEFRERGQVAKSPELASAFLLGAGALALVVTASAGSDPVVRYFTSILSNVDQTDRALNAPITMLRDLLVHFAMSVAAALLLLGAVGIGAHLMQTGPMFTTKALRFDLSRMKLFSNLKRVFWSRDSLVNLFKTIAKALVVGGVALSAVLASQEQIAALVSQSPADLAQYLLDTSTATLAACAACMLLIGGAHMAWQKRQMRLKMMMTREEATRDRKESDGDPLIRGRARQKHREILSMNRMLSEVSSADVVLVNPTHYAVALRYRPAEGAPRVVAKGVDLFAARIRDVARTNGVPIISNPSLARALHSSVPVGHPISETFYRAVSEVLAVVMMRRGWTAWRSADSADAQRDRA
jgi:flagellar biosynthetic protein FlhB